MSNAASNSAPILVGVAINLTAIVRPEPEVGGYSASIRRGRAVKAVSRKRMCRILDQRGWILARINGAHHIYRQVSTGRRTVDPAQHHA